MSLKHPILLLTFIIPAIASCDPQVDGNYNGTPLARLNGTIQDMRTQGFAPPEVALLWANTSDGSNLLASDLVEVEAYLPTAFRFSLYEPPDDMLINSYPDGSRIGIACILSGTALDGETSLDTIFGMDTDHRLVYLPADVAAGSHVSTLLRGTPRAGFHLYNVGHLTKEKPQARQACKELPADPTLQDVYYKCGGSPICDDLLPSADGLETPLQVDLVDSPSEQYVPSRLFDRAVSPK